MSHSLGDLTSACLWQVLCCTCPAARFDLCYVKRCVAVSLHASSMVIVLFCVLVVRKGCSNLQRYVCMGSCCMVGVV